jgi:hypothetical protein
MNLSRLILAAILSTVFCAFTYAGDKGAFSENQICKAGIAKIMGRDPAIIKIDRVALDAIYLSYVRSDDQSKWKYKCKLKDSRINWGSDTGRWRTHPMDSKVTFKVSGNLITVTDVFSDGSSSSETYSLNQVGK